MKTIRLFSLSALLAGTLSMLQTAAPLPAQQIDESQLKGMKWRLVGPHRGGRVLAVAGIPGDPYTFYFGAVAGGVWKTTDAGVTWTPLFDKQAVSSIGAIAVSPSDPNVIYVGTGEACIRGNISFGDGVYKSVDAGKTWKHIGLTDTRHIGALIVHPRNPEIAFVAALGHAYGPNTERGIFRSTDGGKTWEKVLYKDEKTGGIDITFDPTNPNILFASLWQVQRTPWSLTSGGPGSGLYKSIDGGSTWKRLEGGGLPKGILGRIGVSVSGADPNRVYALIEAEAGGLYRSDDGGEKWTHVTDDRRILQRAWYYMHVVADPKHVDTVYFMNVGFFRSTDGGKTLTPIAGPHGDYHALWIDPTNPQRMISGNDGGATISVDGGKTWSSIYNQPTAQFYHVAVDNAVPYRILGAQQDNSTIGIASRSDDGTIGRADWSDVGGGESGYIVPHPHDPDIVYAGSYVGVLTRWDRRTRQAQSIDVWPDNTSGHGAAHLRHRFNWTSPVLISRHDPKVLFIAGERVFKTTNEGMSWTPISPDLTRNEKEKQQASGGPLTKDNTGVEYYNTIFALADSAFDKDLLWAGTDDGLVHLTRDGGKTWTNVSPQEMPQESIISIIESSPHAAGAAFLAVDRHKSDDYRPYIYKTKDYGKSWTKIVGGLPEKAYVHAVREDPGRKGLLYAGTETGIFFSLDEGAHWQPLQLNLPMAPIHDLVVKDNDLVVATHGRSFWVLDDLSPLRQVGPEVTAAEVHFYKPATAFKFRAPSEDPKKEPVGKNPPAGAVLYYSLKSVPKDEITLEISDHSGKVIRKYSSKEKKEEEEKLRDEPEEEEAKALKVLPAEAGLNRFVWDLRLEPPTRVAGAAFTDYEPKGPWALPGTYQAKLTVAGKSLTQPIELKLDPRVKTPQADLEKQHALAVKIRDRVNEAHSTINKIRDLRAQIKALKKRLGEGAEHKAIVAAADQFDKAMTAVEEELIQVKNKASEDSLNFPVKLNDRFVQLAGVVSSADAAPPQQFYELFDVLSKQLDEQLAKWKSIVEKDLAAVNELIRKENVLGISPAP